MYDYEEPIPLRNKLVKKSESRLPEVTFGILTALPKESAACLNVFDLFGTGHEETVRSSSGEVTCTTFDIPSANGGIHVVTIAQLPDMGNNSAAVGANILLHTCKNIKYLIMCGIAGAIPNPGKAEDHVRLGDIIVIDRSGVVQYDFGKLRDPKAIESPIVEDPLAAFEVRSAPRAPDPDLLASIRRMLVVEERMKREELRPWEEIILKFQDQEKWKQPHRNCDSLNDTPNGNGDKTRHPKDKHRRTVNQFRMPRVFHGKIGAANIVLADPVKRDALRRNFGVRAVEMEGSGIADASWVAKIGYLIVRGACDYCNSCKNDNWQHYAALVAASYTFCVIKNTHCESDKTMSSQLPLIVVPEKIEINAFSNPHEKTSIGKTGRSRNMAYSDWTQPKSDSVGELSKINEDTCQKRPIIVLLTVNQNETNAVFDAFLGQGVAAKTSTRNGVDYSILGMHGGHEIVHVISEMGTGGIGASQQRTKQAIDQWNPRAVIAVGIAFGLDETKQAIGDVLVSKQLQDYDLGRVNEDGSLTPRGDRVHCASNLLSRLRAVDSNLHRIDSEWPKVRFGLMLSGQKLVDNFDYRESLKSLAGGEAIGGEMEGGGLYASAHIAKVDWIVIKAICDWGHNKNNADKDGWQRIAATNAAKVAHSALAAGPLYEIEQVEIPVETVDPDTTRIVKLTETLLTHLRNYEWERAKHLVPKLEEMVDSADQFGQHLFDGWSALARWELHLLSLAERNGTKDKFDLTRLQKFKEAARNVSI